MLDPRAPRAGAGFRVHDLVVDLVRQRVTRGDQEIHLPKLSFDLLAALVRAAPELVSVDALMSAVWPKLVVGPETVAQRVKLVRAALGDDSKQPRYIAGVRGRGYRVVAPVTPLAAVPPLPRLTQAAPPELPASQPPAAATAKRPRLAWRRPIAAALAVLAVAAAGFAWLSGPADRPEAGGPRIAVLPFENLSPDAKDAFFADGMHHEVIAALARRAPSAGVIARSTMMTYRDRPRARASEIAADLGVTHVVETTVSRDGDNVRLNVSLIDARSDTSLWSQAYAQTLADAVSLPSEVSGDIAAQLTLGSRAAADGSGTRVPAAYDAYLTGLVARGAAAGPFATVAVLDSIESSFAKAIELDPAFADAYAERAALRLAKVAINADTSDAQIERARQDLAAAERLAPAAPKTLAARAWYLMWVDWDAPGAQAQFAAAEAAGLADPQWILDVPSLLVRLGQHGEVLRVLEQAWAIDPRNVNAAVTYARHLSAYNRPADALRALRFSLEQSPGNPSPQGFINQIRWVYGGNFDLVAESAEVIALSPPWTDGSEAIVPIALAFEVLRWTGNVETFARMLDGVRSSELRGSFPTVGAEPVARYRGWTSLLLERDAAAAEQGRFVREFLASTAETPRNRFFRGLLESEAYLFEGQPERALEAARALERLPEPIYSYDTRLPKMLAAIYAWGGAPDEAVDLLERLSEELPRVGPGEIVHDPLYTMPLAENARFRELVARLEAEMRTTVLD